MFLQYFNIKKNNQKDQSLSIYQEIVDNSNYFIKKNSSEKYTNFNDVFEIFSIVIVFYLKKLNVLKTLESKNISQTIVNNFINDLDQHFREQGIGDMSIGKYVKKHVKKFYYRIKILDKILNENKDINFETYLQKFSILKYEDNKKISRDLNDLFNGILIDK